MKAVESKVKEFRKKQEKLNEIKKKMIDAEISWLMLRQTLNLTQYEYQKLKSGELEEWEADVLKVINKTPKHIVKRNAGAKRFKKVLIDKGIGIKDFCNLNNINHNKLYRTLRGITASRDYEVEKQVERALGKKIFY
ncbi:MAG: hypothetical protein CR959_02085 [Fusobacteriales bacterium]|nr:MAG: hypothetical protein CR959_02085 [Fusobacteriales bacterium]